MPKQKTHKGAAKRIKKTGTGKLLIRPAGGGHLMTKKRQSRKRGYAKLNELHKTVIKAVKKQLG